MERVTNSYVICYMLWVMGLNYLPILHYNQFLDKLCKKAFLARVKR